MIDIQCIIQEGQTASSKTAVLEEGLSRIAREFFDVDVRFSWTTVASGSGFTGGKPSTSSLVSMPVPADIKQERRIELLSVICNMWSEATSCHVNDVVAVARNETA